MVFCGAASWVLSLDVHIRYDTRRFVVKIIKYLYFCVVDNVARVVWWPPVWRQPYLILYTHIVKTARPVQVYGISLVYMYNAYKCTYACERISPAPIVLIKCHIYVAS